MVTERRRSGSVEPIGGGEDVKQEALAAGAEEARKRKRRPGGGRKRKRPDYDAGRNLEELMDAAEKLHADIHRSYVFEDAKSGVQAAVAAGAAKVIAVAGTADPEALRALGAAQVIESYRKLL